MTDPVPQEAKGLKGLGGYLPEGAEKVIEIYELGRRSAIDSKQIIIGFSIGASSLSAFWVWFIYAFFILPLILGGL